MIDRSARRLKALVTSNKSALYVSISPPSTLVYVVDVAIDIINSIMLRLTRLLGQSRHNIDVIVILGNESVDRVSHHGNVDRFARVIRLVIYRKASVKQRNMICVYILSRARQQGMRATQ